MSSDPEGPYADISRQVWTRHHGVATARAELLAAVLGARARGEPIAPDHIATAREAAHQLAGTLAVYGLSTCARLAMRLQRALDAQHEPQAWAALGAMAAGLGRTLAATTDG